MPQNGRVRDIDLAKAAVFFDFDGTISTTDIGVYLLDKLAEGDWRALGEQFERGEIGSRECMEKEWATIPGTVDEATRRATAAEVPLDPAFGPLADALRAAGAEVAVVSDGFGFYVHERLAEFDVPVFTNGIDFDTNTVSFPNGECAHSPSCGTCKPVVISDAAARGRTTIFVGDGISDRHAARVADVVFATKSLARWCAQENIAYTHFDTLGDVAAVLLP
jgi:2-hydroxy-3-keto-5-methylthiopentenyl-1-phosphate phosphatase